MANVLIVDDSRTSRKILRTILERAGHTVVGEASNGEEGVRAFQEHKPEVVTMDVTMPVIDGVEALKMIKALRPESKVIMVTAAGKDSKVTECIKAGADEFVTKPYEDEAIINAIAKII
ncbi:MAG: response regulator [Lachnospiraceae bacterium]|jgi:two-component system chemotaxis response regulator CheY|nr:response regulator [Lachnospiraceae bacterium]